MLSELNENKLIKTKLHFKIILENGFNIIKENSSEIDVYHSLFKRFINCIDSINLLIVGFDNQTKHRNQSIAIILRASLLDYLTTLYLRTFQAEKKAGIKSQKTTYDTEVDKLLSEQIRRVLSISEKDKKTSAYNHERFCKSVDNFHHNFKPLFDNSKPIDYNKPANSLKFKQKDDISSWIIRERLDSFSNNLKGIDYLHVFNLYNTYSKFDHFGLASILFEHMDINEICDNMFWSIFHITDGISFCVDLLKDETGCQSNFDRMLKEIDYLRGTIYTKHLILSKEFKEKNK